MAGKASGNSGVVESETLRMVPSDNVESRTLGRSVIGVRYATGI